MGRGDASEVRKYAQKSEVVPIFAFDLEIEFTELLKLIKRVNIVLGSKLLGGTPMTIIEDG